MTSRRILLKIFYAFTRVVIPIQARNRIKRIFNGNRFGYKFLERIDQEKFFSQSSTTINIQGFEILAPERHHLKAIMEREPLRENLLAQASASLLHRDDDKFIDIGANIGDTAAVVYANASKIPKGILIEPSNFFFGYLKENQKLFPKSVLMQNFVAHEFPIQNLQGTLHHWGGTAKFIEGTDSGMQEQVPQIDLIELIDETVRLVKIDCDGMDYRILKSIIPRLQSYRPAIYFENEVTSRAQLQESMEVIELLKEAGYEYVIVARNCGSLIYGGEIGNSLRDIIQLQFALHAQGLRSAIYYTDIIVFSAQQRNEFTRTLERMRTSQESLMSLKFGRL